MQPLSLPQLDAPLDPAFVETRPRFVTEWLERLPFARPVDAARDLTRALAALNRVALEDDARGALLALYRPVVARAASSLETLLLDAGVPPPPQQRQAGEVLRALQIEYGLGCKHVLHALSGRRFGRSQIKHIGAVTAQLLAAWHALQFSCHLTYTPMPPGLWHDLHQTYALAQSNGMADKAVGDTPAAERVYTHALLLELADPPHMSRAELMHIRLYLNAFGERATLGTPTTIDAAHGFAIETSGDRGPHPAGVASEAPATLWLDTEALSRHLHDNAIRLRTGDTPRQVGLPDGMESDISLALAKRLLKLWRPGAHRAFKRYVAPGDAVDVVVGVSAIHRLLELDPQTAEFAPAADDGLAGSAGRSAFSVRATVNASRWTLNNDSAAGLALTGTPDAPLNLKVGDVLAVRAASLPTWSLGVIRWIKMGEAGRVELGIERLSPTIQPVWVRPLKGRRKASPEPGLFVPGIPALKQPDRLLLPSHIQQTGMEAEILHSPRQYTIAFGRRVEFSTSYDLVNFSIVTKEATA